MARYLLVESKNPLAGGDYAFQLGRQLRQLDHDVTIYMVQDAVFTGRRRFDAGEKLVQQARQDGVRLLADEISLRQRGITGQRLSETVHSTGMDELVDLLMERSDKTIWH